MQSCLSLPGHVKVRLTYETAEPTTQAALTLNGLGVAGPFVEEVRILVPQSSAFSDLEAYTLAFRQLKEAKAIPSDAELTGYAFDEESPTVLAYPIKSVFRLV